MVAQRRPAAPTVEAAQLIYDDPQPIRLPADWELTDERFLEIGLLNPDQLFERTADGRLQQMTWPDGLSGHATSVIHAFVTFWALSAGGAARGPDGGYFLSDGLARAPDISWVDAEQIAARGGLRGQFYLAPRFAVEVLSPSQTVRAQQAKMRGWMEHGVRLGWLVDPYGGRVWVYRTDGSVEQLERPAELSGEDVCVGLTVDLARIWEADRPAD